MKLSLCGTAWLLVGFAAARATATDYFVDGENAVAADTNAGTAEAPWLTIGHAADAAVAGDVVHVKGGTYPERIVLTTPGTAGQRIVFQAEPTRAVTMHGFKFDGSHFVTVRGFRITHSDLFESWDETQGVFVGADDVEVLDGSFEELPSAAVVGYWHEPFPQRARIAGNSIYHCQMGLTISGADWVVENNEVNRLYQYGDGDCDYARFFGDRHLIRGNWFHGTDFDEIGAAHVDCFQTFDNNGETGQDIIVEGNVCTDFHQAFMGESSFFHEIHRITFRNNVFAHGLAWGICIGDLAEVFVYNNTFAHIAYHGFGARGAGATGHIVENNIFYDTGSSYWVDEGGAVTGDYNLIFDSSDPSTVGAHDILGEDPLFLDDANDDFHLRAGSPAIDAANTHAEFADDHDGTTRPQGAAWDVGAYEYLASPPLRITTIGLPEAETGVGYAVQLRTTGGVPPYRWSIAAGALPSGLSLAADTGWITGRASAPGTSRFTAQVTDSVSTIDTRELDLVASGASADGCGCSTPSRVRPDGTTLLAPALLAVLALARSRRRRG